MAGPGDPRAAAAVAPTAPHQQQQRQRSTASRQQLSVWGLPQPLLQAFSNKGLKQLYPWQAAALECAAAGNNLVYCAPTSGGKSLVADVLMLSRLHRTQQELASKVAPARGFQKPQQQPVTRALIVLPYLSIVSEKTEHLGKLLECVKWRVMGYKGDDADGQPLSHPAERVSICSIEKASGAINRLIQEQRLHELVSVTIDEAHMLADPNRGAALEMLLSKLMASRSKTSIQIVAMSATMSGLDRLSAWLDAQLFLTNFRPVPLTEHAVFDGTVFVKSGGVVGAQGGAEGACILQEQRQLGAGGTNDTESLLSLVAEVVAESHSVLVFCAGRAAAQSCATMLSQQLPKRLGPPAAAVAAARADLVEQLRIALSGSTDPAFEKLLLAGAAYHHAGLTHQERAVVEQGFSSGALLVLTATSTLAAGVNLPARRVILRSLWQGVGDVSRAQYLQMVGRAGRAGHAAIGESFLMAKGSAHASTGQWGKVCELLAAPLPVLHSRLVQQPAPPPAASRGARLQPGLSGSTSAQAAASQHKQQASSQQLQLSGRSTAAGADSAASSAGGVLSAAAPSGTAASSGGYATQQLSTQQQQQQQQPASKQGSQPPPKGAAGFAADGSVQPYLQHLLLDAVATGLVTTGQTVLQLLESTLAFFHLQFSLLADAAKDALSALRARKLISLKAAGPDGPSHWQLTPLGSAVVASALDPDTGLLLHGRLSSMLPCMVLGTHVHLLYALQPDPLLAVFDWSCHHRLMRELTPLQRRVAELEEIEGSYISRRMAGLRGNAVTDAQHARFAAAVLLDRLVADASSISGLEQDWGQPNTLTKAGISRGTMQRWQSDVSKTAAMAALLASNAGWWQLETLLAPLAAQVAAGVRPELLPLMKVPSMQPTHAAALHAAGLGHPDLLLCASESEVAAALAAGLPANMRKRKPAQQQPGPQDKKGPSAAALANNASTNAMVARAARAVLTAARQFAVQAAAAEAAVAVAAALEGGEGAEDGAGDAAGVPHTQLLPPLVLRTKLLAGQATVHQVWPTKSDPLLAQMLDLWQLQSAFSLAVVVSERHCAAAVPQAAGSRSSRGSAALVCSRLASGAGQQQQLQTAVAGAVCAGLHGPVPSALVLCWADKEAVVLHLPSLRSRSSSSGSGPAAAGGEAAQWVWSAVEHVFGDASRTVSCSGAVQALAALRAIGVSCRAVVDDPATAFLLWQPRGLDSAASAAGAGDQQQQEQKEQQQQGPDDVSKAAATVLLAGSFRLQVPLLPGSSSGSGSSGAAVTAAAKAALLSKALMPPLRAVLAKQQLSAAYEGVEQPLLQALADVRSAGLRISRQSLQQRLQLCDWQCSMLQQQVSQLMGHHQQQQQQQSLQPFSPQGCSSGAGLLNLDDSGVRLLLHQQRLLAISNDKLQQTPLIPLLLLAVRTAVKRSHTAALPLLRLLLSHSILQQQAQQLRQLQQQYAAAPRHTPDDDCCYAYDDGSSSHSHSQQGVAVLQPQPGVEPVTGQLTHGWPAGFEAAGCGLAGFCHVAPALPVLTSAASLAQLGSCGSLTAPVTAAAALQQPSQQQQQQAHYVLGQLCSVAAGHTAAAAGGGGVGGTSGQQQQQWIGSVRVWCGVTGGIQELQLPLELIYSTLPPQQQQHQQQQDGSSSGSSNGCLAFLPGCCSISGAIRPSSPAHTFIGVHIPQGVSELLVLAGLSGDRALLSAACVGSSHSYSSQAADPLAAAAAAWLQCSGLQPQLQAGLLANIAAGVLDGVPAPAGGTTLAAAAAGAAAAGAAAAPRLLMAVAVQALALGLKPSLQRDQLGAGGGSSGGDSGGGGVDWPKGTCLADSLLSAFGGLGLWRDRLLEGAKSSRFIRTVLGRRIPFRMPPSTGPNNNNNTKAAAKLAKEAQRSAVSLALLASVGDVQRLLVAAMQRACAEWQARSSQHSGGGGAGSAPAEAGGGAAAQPSQPQQQQQQQCCRFVAISGQQVVLEVPSAWALPLLQRCSQVVSQEVCAALGLTEAHSGSGAPDAAAGWTASVGGGGAAAGGREPAATGAVHAAVRLPFRWWWGSSMDVLEVNYLAC